MAGLRTFKKFVDIPGIVTVKYVSDDPEFFKKPEDLFEFQDHGIPPGFGKKDKRTTVQAMFECRLCDCELKSVETFEAHSRGVPHMTKVLKEKTDRKRREELKRKAEDRAKDDGSESLEQVLPNLEFPVVGLRYVTETKGFRRNSEAMYLYTCSICNVS